jgi:diguanylate cyclase (GGDEF)-like protein
MFIDNHRQKREIMWFVALLTIVEIIDEATAQLVNDTIWDYGSDIASTLTIFIFIYYTINKLRKNTLAMEQLAYYDTLTTIPNRNYLYKYLDRLLNDPKHLHNKIALFFIDLDRFKNVNDTLGHNYGDELLKQAAARLKELLSKDSMLFRYAGDEFIVLIENVTEKTEVQKAAENIIKGFSNHFHLENYDIYASCSIGISIYGLDSMDRESLIKNADIAMQRIKEDGRNYYEFYSNEMESETKRKLELENALRKALADNELELYYQPKFDPITSQIVGTEALIRWNHPTLGVISPAEFIPIAEETNLIIQIGEWVLREACIQNKQWQNQELSPISVSVNLSARQLLKDDLDIVIQYFLKESGLEAKYLNLEITETMAMKNIEHSIKKISELKEIGVTFSLDDFGTGYSSLSYLQKLPVDFLKIDKSFIQNMNESEISKAITHSIISVAHSLNIKVVAEGVETKEQLESLIAQNCNEIQGYYFSRPLSVGDFEKNIQPLMTTKVS